MLFRNVIIFIIFKEIYNSVCAFDMLGIFRGVFILDLWSTERIIQLVGQRISEPRFVE